MLCFTFEFHAYAWECQVGSVPGAALPLTVATLAVVRRNRFGGDIITDRTAGASAGISLAHDFSPTNKALLGHEFRGDRTCSSTRHPYLVAAAQTSMRSGLRRAFAQRFRGVVFRSVGAAFFEDFRPHFTHILESSVVLRRDEAGMDKAKARSVFNPGKNPRDDSLQP